MYQCTNHRCYCGKKYNYSLFSTFGLPWWDDIIFELVVQGTTDCHTSDLLKILAKYF